MSEAAAGYLIVGGVLAFAWISLFVLRRRVRSGFVLSVMAVTSLGAAGGLEVYVTSQPPDTGLALPAIAALAFFLLAVGLFGLTIRAKLRLLTRDREAASGSMGAVSNKRFQQNARS